MPVLSYTIIPLLAILLGSIVALARPPGPRLVSAMQHLAAGVVFAAAATEIVPQVMHGAFWVATLVGGALGVVTMLALKAFEGQFRGPAALLGAVAIDIAIDGLVLGLAFVVGAKAGLLLTIALTLEVLFLGLTLTTELSESIRSKAKIIMIVAAIALLLPGGAAIGLTVAELPPAVIVGFLSFGLMALLYLVTEELLTDAHAKRDTPLVAAMFFVGFLALLLIEELMA
ncbi:transporter [Sphingomonas sp. G-3-2-10]|uniref:ZIP family metal transporter n=1 Tax=Sphingomonas sp. G-3-2-10 TaxID=2728838 RepID=UPI00146A998C|nr:transporter [Sphingomonas sp. G-3-2-10]NML06760.1 transporter [Sphingomonas sp. G-3-2-10]